MSILTTQIYPVFNEVKLAVRVISGHFLIMDINNTAFYREGIKLRELGIGIKFTTNDIIKSCLGYYEQLL